MFSGYCYLFQKIIEKGEWESFLRYALRARLKQRWSLFNSALAYSQRSGCVYLATETKWEKMGRTIKASATPIVIMQPFGPVTFVYDLADTEGDYVSRDLQEYLDFIEPPLQPLSEETIESLKYVCRCLKIKYSEKQMGAGKAGFASIRGNFLEPEKNKKRKIGWYEIVINTNCNATAKALTILHELGHILCGHLVLTKEQRRESALTTPDRSKEKLNRNIEEWEAEKVCEVTCRMLGLYYDSTDYLAGYGYYGYECGENSPVGDVRIVLDASDKIMKLVDKYRYKHEHCLIQGIVEKE